MITDKYITPEELRDIAKYCEVAKPLWNALVSDPRDKVSIEILSFELDVYDSNGDKLGVITWADTGPAFFLDNGEDAKS